jgi:hypothetical protein
MKKIRHIFLLNLMLATNAFAFSSIVNLSGGGDVATSGSINLPLTGLIPSAVYSISCNITAPKPFQFVRFGINYGSGTGTVSSYNLNGDTLTQGQLIPGQNSVTIIGSFDAPTTTSIVFTNLDQDYTFNVNSCYAAPLIGINNK